GVYDCDPAKNPEATRYNTLPYSYVLRHELAVMDSTAIALCKDNNIPIVIFNLFGEGNIKRAAMGETIGTTVGGFCEVS
ncbi:MAG: UMP kinase, partial [Prochlorothrix sp.]